MLALIPIALKLIPEIADWIAGDKTGKVAEKVASAVSAVTRTEDPAAAQAAISADQQLAAQLRIELAKIGVQAAKDQHDAAQAELASRLADVGDGRRQTEDLIAKASPIAWGAPVLSIVILISFAVMLYVVLKDNIPKDSQNMAQILLGTLAAMATQVAYYWLGSSQGSASKNLTIAGAAAALAVSTPPGIPKAAR